MSELGPVAMACAHGAAIDDAHLLKTKVAVIQAPAGPFYFTSLHQSCPKLMINVEVGDTGVLERRDCGCPLGEAGFDLHISAIRSYEKLTSEGVQLLPGELLNLLEHVLPQAFGGGPADYQLIEEEDRGLPTVNLVVSPVVGPVDEQASGAHGARPSVLAVNGPQPDAGDVARSANPTRDPAPALFDRGWEDPSLAHCPMNPAPRLARWRSALGPGLVFALTASGPGSFVSNAAAGATYGYALIWALGFTVVFRYAWLSTSAKYVLVTGETLLDGYRRLGKVACLDGARRSHRRAAPVEYVQGAAARQLHRPAVPAANPLERRRSGRWARFCWPSPWCSLAATRLSSAAAKSWSP